MKTERRRIKIDGVFDIETMKLTRYVCGGFLTKKGYHFFGPGSEVDMVEAILATQGSVWAHFGGGFDFKWLLDWIIILHPEQFVDIFVANSRIIMMKVGKLRLFDSYALAPMSLEKLTKGLGVEKQELHLDCTCENYCGGWCTISPTMPEQQYRLLVEYLEYDCRSLWTALHALQDFADEKDLDLGATIGSSAWRNAKRMLDLEDAKWTDDEYDYIRLAYFGGRVQLLRHGNVAASWYYDVNSMYPFQLASMLFPTGERIEGSGLSAKHAYQAGKEGVFTAQVTVPDQFLPPLPIRYLKRGSIKATAYPTGTFRGTWSALELRAAEEDGTQVTILRGIWWESAEKIYAPWINRVWNIRQSFGKESPLGQFAKLYGNSFSGKLSARPDRNHYSINGTVTPCTCNCLGCGKDAGACLCDGGHMLYACHCGASHMVGDYTVATPYRQIDACAHIHHGLYVTAGSRVMWRRFAMKAGVESTIYGDTDSNINDAPFQGSSPELGGWAAKRILDFHGIAPKSYTFRTETGATEARAKGIFLPTYHKRLHDGSPDPRAKQLIVPLEVGRKYQKEIVNGFRAGAANNRFFSKSVLERTLSSRSGDRVILDDGIHTRPKTYKEILAEGMAISAREIRNFKK